MGRTSIQWTDRTWNPVRGCSLVSPGCTNCYAMKQAHRFSAPGGPYAGLTQLSHGGPVWTGKVRTVPELLTEPLRWRKPSRVFVNSMSDLFHEDVPGEFLDKVFAVMAMSPEHTFQVLTKRPERMAQYMGMVDEEKDMQRWINAAHDMPGVPGDALGYLEREVDYPLPNVWFGVSVERQKEAEERIRWLLKTAAAVRWISAEPLLGSVDLTALCYREDGCDCRWNALTAEHWIDNSDSADCYANADDGVTKLDWVVVGGESGIMARPFDVNWARRIVQDCKAAGVPVFMKQLGALPVGLVLHDLIPLDTKGGDQKEWPEDLRVREYPA